jgi:hypothetical protein
VVYLEGWLRYCRWYYGTALNDQVTIEDFFNAPIATVWPSMEGGCIEEIRLEGSHPSGSLPEPCLLGGVTGSGSGH